MILVFLAILGAVGLAWVASLALTTMVLRLIATGARPGLSDGKTPSARVAREGS